VGGLSPSGGNGPRLCCLNWLQPASRNCEAKRSYINHQTLSFDAYAKFIEDDSLGGRRLDPRTDGRPDPRPDVREQAPILGNLANDFNFTQKARPPLVLDPSPRSY